MMIMVGGLVSLVRLDHTNCEYMADVFGKWHCHPYIIWHARMHLKSYIFCMCLTVYNSRFARVGFLQDLAPGYPMSPPNSPLHMSKYENSPPVHPGPPPPPPPPFPHHAPPQRPPNYKVDGVRFLLDFFVPVDGAAGATLGERKAIPMSPQVSRLQPPSPPRRDACQCQYSDMRSLGWDRNADQRSPKVHFSGEVRNSRCMCDYCRLYRHRV